ncbi:S41 family peptidase [Mucilaginibacter sp. BT774]|uniref:S41 family peptidase n=1 Tax=Mucilaginibacter sp. BT774 TaxID=3062276 RepID=UPI002675DF91|nr:S41 family peptidase [Mucilaginibacter sp. BT774]MDO3624789.1 S41 family peptidase [Mucilaginibacter sp. BT774]
MKRTFSVLALFIFATSNTFSQSLSERKFSQQQLKEDLAYLRQQLFNVHINPYTELNKEQYEQLFASINTKLKDSLSATDFLKLVKPTIAYLSDEHAGISLQTKMLTKSYQNEPVFCPLSLTKDGNNYKITKVLSGQADLLGKRVAKIDGVAIEGVLNKCALYAAGYPDQRKEKALTQFGSLYTLSLTGVQHRFIIKTSEGKNITIQGVTLQTWLDELSKQTGWNDACNEAISYQKIDDAGYIYACSFGVSDTKMDSLKNKLNTIFEQVQKDNVKYLFIDVSKNGGGNSMVGNVLIDYFYDKSYGTYRCDWKKSEEYLKLLKSWGGNPGDQYNNAADGDVLHFLPDTVDAAPNPYRFKGKVFVVVGNGTFSSAIMFATMIKDNHIATLAGQIPANGHPNHFGEMYNTKLPNTRIDLRFGVKEWIRPSGEKVDNNLHPDILVDPSESREELVKEVIERAK